MVGVVQLVERQIVDLVVVGSSPMSHPSDYRINSGATKSVVLGCRQAVRHWTLTPTFVGSNPTTPANSPNLKIFKKSLKKSLHFYLDNI